MSDANYTYNPLPESSETVVTERRELASRGSRLGAAMLDSLAFGVCYIPMLVLIPLGTNAFDGDGFGTGGVVSIIVIALAGLLFIGMAIVQLVFMYKRSQSIGKRLLGLIVCDRDTGLRASPGKNIGMRTMLNGVISSVPYLGSVYGLVDALFIFGEEKRCLHDLLANTIVARARASDFD